MTEEVKTENVSTEVSDTTTDEPMTDSDYQAAALALLRGRDIPSGQTNETPPSTTDASPEGDSSLDSATYSATLEALQLKQSEMAKQMEEMKVGAAKYNALKEALEKKDTNGVFDNLGMSYEKLTDMILESDDPDNQFASLKNDVATQLESQKSELEKIKETLATKEIEVQTKAYYNTLDSAVNAEEDKNRWGLLTAHDDWKTEVLEYATMVYEKTGKAITVDLALDDLEKASAQQVESVLGMGEKAQRLLMEKLGITKSPRSNMISDTLSNNASSTPAPKVPEELMTDQDYIDRAIFLAGKRRD